MGEQGAQQPPPARALQPRWPRSPGNPDPWDTAPSSRGLSLGQGGQSGCPRGGRGEAGWAGENPAPRAPSQPLGKAASVSLLALSHDQKVQKKEIGQRYLEGGNALGLLSKNFAHTNFFFFFFNFQRPFRASWLKGDGAGPVALVCSPRQGGPAASAAGGSPGLRRRPRFPHAVPSLSLCCFQDRDPFLPRLPALVTLGAR